MQKLTSFVDTDGMKRLLHKALAEWKHDKHRKPLILRGARQVGKTYLLKEFGATAFDKFVYINFEEDERLAQLFD